MKNSFVFPVLILIAIGCNSCKKEELLPASMEYGIQPANEVNLLNRSFQMAGHHYDEILPAASAGSNIIIQGQPSAIEVSAGVLMYIPFTTTNSDEVCEFYIQAEGADSYWAVPAKKDSLTGNFNLEILIPNFVQKGKFNIVFAAVTCDGVVSKYVTTNTIISAPGSCGSTMSGSVGLTIRQFYLGDKPGIVTITYNMYSIPDRLDLRYNGIFVGSTGTLLAPNQYPDCNFSDGYVSGSQTLTFQYDPSVSRILEVYLKGCDPSTAWDVTVSCP